MSNTDTAKQPGGVSIEWSLARDGETLRISYTVSNRRSEAIWLLDQVPKQRSYVQRGKEPGQVRLVRGHLRPDSQPGIEQGVARERLPSARKLDAGASVTGTDTIPLPLTAYHPSMDMASIDPKAHSAILEIGYLSGAIEWAQPGIPKRGFVIRNQAFLVAGPKPIP